MDDNAPFMSPELIDESFLPDNNKRELQQVLAAEGESERFCGLLNDHLGTAFAGLSDQVEAYWLEADEALREAKTVYEQQQRELEAVLERELADLTMERLEERGAILDRYYAALDKLGQEYINDARQRIAAWTMKRA